LTVSTVIIVPSNSEFRYAAISFAAFTSSKTGVGLGDGVGERVGVGVAAGVEVGGLPR